MKIPDKSEGFDDLIEIKKIIDPEFLKIKELNFLYI